MDVFLTASLLTAIFVGIGIGANTVPKAIGTVQCVLFKNYFKLALFLSIFIMLGGVLHSHSISKTIGKGLIPSGNFEGNFRVVCILFLTTGLITLGLSFMGLPGSVSQIMVGSVLGVGLAMGLSEEIHYALIFKIIAAWVSTPILACAITYLIYKTIVPFIEDKTGIVNFSRICMLLTLLGAIIISYDIGANNVGVILGPLVGSDLLPETNIFGIILTPRTTMALAIGLLLSFGAILLGEPIARTVGKKICMLDPISAFSSQLGAGIVIYLFINFGIPVSTGQAVLGGISGVSLSRGKKFFGNKIMGKIVILWLSTPLLALGLSALLYRIIVIL